MHRALFALLLFLVAATAEAGARREPPAVLLGEITTSVSRPNLDLEDALRHAALRELGRVDLTHVARQGRFVLSVKLERMETRLAVRRASTTCVVSATLRNERGGALLAVFGGRARAEDHARAVSTLELGALRAAVHGAMARLPEALQ